MRNMDGRTEGQTNMMKQIVPFRNFLSAPKKPRYRSTRKDDSVKQDSKDWCTEHNLDMPLRHENTFCK